jgi:glycosyltransferase involved in cell wall biosynthesis
MRVAFFESADVFEDFYPHIGVTQSRFATDWAGSGNHRMLTLVQADIGDVVWLELSLRPEVLVSTHRVVGCEVRIIPSSLLHRGLWRLMYGTRVSWRLRRLYPAYATIASYLAPLSLRLWRETRRVRPDAIFVQDYASGRFDVLLVLARLLRARFVAYHAGSQPDQYVGRRLRRFSLKRADHVLASSARERESLVSEFGVARERTSVVLTPIDTERYRPLSRSEACGAAGLDSRFRYILFVGRFDDQVKRVSSLIRAFAVASQPHSDARLMLVGDGPDRAPLTGLAQDLCPGRVIMRGWVPDEESLARIYNASEVLVLPSRREGFPTVVGEALACGLPVIATDVGGVSEVVVPSETGWLTSAGDDRQLTTAIAEALGARAVVQAMRSKARAMAESRLAPAAVVSQLRRCLAGTGGAETSER